MTSAGLSTLSDLPALTHINLSHCKGLRSGEIIKFISQVSHWIITIILITSRARRASIMITNHTYTLTYACARYDSNEVSPSRGCSWRPLISRVLIGLPQCDPRHPPPQVYQ